MAPVTIGLACAGLWWTSQLLFLTQRLAVLEGTMPASAMTRTEKVATAVL